MDQRPSTAAIERFDVLDTSVRANRVASLYKALRYILDEDMATHFVTGVCRRLGFEASKVSARESATVAAQLCGVLEEMVGADTYGWLLEVTNMDEPMLLDRK